MHHMVEQRDTQVSLNIFKGFSAVHYAIFFGHFELYKLLSHWEFDCLTQEEVPIERKHLRANSNIIQLAMITSQLIFVHFIVVQFERFDKFRFLAKTTTANGQNILTSAIKQPYDISSPVLNCVELVEELMQEDYPSDLVPVSLMAWVNQKQHAQLLRRWIDNPKLQKITYKQLLMNSSSLGTIIQ